MDAAKTKGVLLCTLSALLYGLNAVLLKQLTLLGMSVAGMVVLRSLLAMALVGAWLKLRGVKLLPEEKGSGRLLVLHSLGGAGLTMVLLNLSYLYLSAGMATTLHYLYPLLVNLGGFALFGEKLRRSTLGVLAVVVAGVALLAGGGGDVKAAGVILAVGSGCTWAFHMLFLDHTPLKSQPPLRLTFWQATASALLGLVLVPVKGESLVQGLSLPALGLLVLSALCALVFANALLNRGIQWAGSPLASIFNVFEPIGSIVFGMLFLLELPTPRQWVGMGLVLGAIAFLLLSNFRSHTRA